MAQLVLHGVTTNMYYQFFSKPNLVEPPIGGWALGEVQLGDPWCNSTWTNCIWFQQLVPCTDPPNNFFRAVGAANEAYISQQRYYKRAIRPDANYQGGQNAQFDVCLYQPPTSPLTVYYSMSGTAKMPDDYTLSGTAGSVTFPANSQSVTVVVQPQPSSGTNFDVSATFTLVQTNGYVVDPTNASTTITISDNLGTNSYFGIVWTNDPSWGWTVDIDYFAPSNCLLLSLGYANGQPFNFGLLRTDNTNNTVTQWSSVANVGDDSIEVKIATAKSATNGMARGDLFFGTPANGGIGRVLVDGPTATVNWLTLTNQTTQTAEPEPVSGDLYVDETGIWGNDLLAVTGYDSENPGTHGVWRVNPTNGVATQITRIPGQHLEGILTLPNDSAKYGPWAGRLITGDEFLKRIYAVETNGGYTPYNLGISPDTFRLIPANQDLYCCVFSPSGENYVVKLSRRWLASYVGDVLIIQSGEIGMGEAAVHIVHWNGTGFTDRAIPLSLFGDSTYCFHKAAFAPVDLPVVANPANP